MVSQLSRQRGPYDIQLTYSGTSQDFMLAKGPDGALLYRAGLIEEVVAQQRTDAFSYQHRSPLLDIPAAFEDFSLGGGFEDAPDTGEAGFKGYNFTQGVDLSYGTRGYLSPLVQTAGSALTGTGAKKIVLTSLGLFAINDRYVNRWSGTAWTQPLDAGAGGVVNDIFEYANSVGTYVVAALRGGSYYYSTDGLVFTILETAGAVPAFRSVASATTAGATTLTPAEPVGAAQNDILIMIVSASATAPDAVSNITMNDAAFWTQLTSSIGDGSDGYGWAWWGRRGAGAPDYQVNFATSGAGLAVVAAYSGSLATGSPIDVLGTGTTGTGTAHTVGAITTTGANRLAIGVLTATNGATGNATVSPGTERSDTSHATQGNVYLFDASAATAGSQGAWTVTTANSIAAGKQAFAIKPALPVGANNVTRWAARGQSSGAPVLWAIDANGAIRNATLATSASNWSASDSVQVGQRSVTQLGLEVIDNEFFLVHDGGITSYDGTTVSTVFTQPFASPPSDAARPALGPDNRLYLTFGSSLLKFDPTNNTITKIWPRGPQEGNGELNGTITAIAPSEKFIYFAINNSAGNRYIMRIDPALTATVGSETIYPAHPIIYRGANAVTALAYIKADSDALSSTNPTLMLTSGLTVSYCVLARPGLRPEDDTNYRFDTTADRLAFGSFVNFRAQGFPKWLTRGDIEARTTTAETIALQYQVPAGTATALTTANTAQTGRTTAVLATPVSFTRVRYRAVFNTGGNTLSPALRGFVLHAAPNAPRDIGFSFTVKLRDDQETNHTGVRSRYKAANQRTFLNDAVNQIVTLRDMLGTSYTTKVLDIHTAAVRYDKDGEPEEWVEVVLGQLNS